MTDSNPLKYQRLTLATGFKTSHIYKLTLIKLDDDNRQTMIDFPGW
jgi:hypothetical protein